MSEAYKRARKLGEKDYHAALAASVSPYLPALDEMITSDDTAGTEPLGVLEIPTRMVVGTRTSGRQQAFARNFMPLLAQGTEFSSKWEHLYGIQVREGFRDPVKVLEFMHRFYVQEGNKRVSVLKYVGAPTTRADVTRLLPSSWEGADRGIYSEFLQFWKVAHTYDVDFSHEGSYAKLAAHFGRDLVNPWPDDAINNLCSTIQYFESVFLKRGGNRLHITPGDALLGYLDFYSDESVLDTPSDLLSARIGKLWGELSLKGEVNNLVLVGSPGEGGPHDQDGAASGSAGNLTVQPVVPASIEPAGTSSSEVSAHPVTSFASSYAASYAASLMDEKGGGPVASALSKPLSVFGQTELFSDKNPLRVAFVYRRNTYVSRWALAHDLGREKLEGKFGGLVVTEKYEDCATDRLVRDAIDKAVQRGADVVITTSPTQMDETTRAAIHYPKVRFLNCSLNLPRNSVRSFYGRTYETKFLMGVLAASMATNHKLGYCADAPVFGTVADINAFAIGAGLVDPRAKVYLKWASCAHRDWQEELLDEGVRVVSGADAAFPFADDNAYGLYEVLERGASSMDAHYPVHNLALPVWNWDRYYELIVQSILRGTWDKVPTSDHAQAVNYWYGISSGVIDVALPLSLPYYSRKLVDMLRTGIVKGAVDPFAGELHSQEGVVKGEDSAPLTSTQIVSMDWLNDNVVGCIPDASQLTRPAREEVQISGVREK